MNLTNIWPQGENQNFDLNHFFMSNKSKRENNSTSKQSNKEIECYSCHRKLKNERYVQCSKCFNTFQCLQCISVGLDRPPFAIVIDPLKPPPHQFTHQFVIAEPPSSPPHPFTRQNWDQHEEILLLYGVKYLGLGNWHSIADFVHTKTAIECEIHYVETYINSPLAPFPPNYKSINKSIIKRDKEREKQKDKQKQKDRNHEKDKEKRKTKDTDKDKDSEKKKKSSKSADNLTLPKSKPTDGQKNDFPESTSVSSLSKDSKSLESSSSSSSSHHHHHSHHHDSHHDKDDNDGVEILPELPIPDPPAFDTRPVDSLPSEGNPVHLNEKQKKEPTLPAEYSDYMPFRHEFDKDKDFEADGEKLVANIQFSQYENQETIETFREKVDRLKNYNKILAERRFRTEAVEKWNIHYTEVAQPKNKHGSNDNQSGSNLDPRSDSNLNRYSNYYHKLPQSLDFNDFDNRFLGGRTVEDREVDIKLIPLGSYFKKEPIQELAKLIHNRITKQYLIKTRNNWQNIGIKTIKEGQLYQALQEKIKDDKIIPNQISDWNDRINKYNGQDSGEKESECDSLLQCEKEIIKKYKLHYQQYMSLKNLLIREYMIYQKLPRSRMLSIQTEMNLPHLDAVYDLCVNCGWIAP